MPTNPLALVPGVHAWVWPLNASTDWTQIVDRAADLGLAGLIPQAGLGAPAWVSPAMHAHARAAGLQVTCGLGMDGASGYRDNPILVARSILAGLDEYPGAPVMLNWEGQWEDEKSDKVRATAIVDHVLAQRPDAAPRCVDAPWWAPLYRLKANGRKGYTHPSAPTREFGRLCHGGRWVQAYGANVDGSPDGASTRMLAWARDPSQYPALGTPADRVMPAFQGYHRTLHDQVASLLAEPTVCLWVFKSIDVNCELALRVVKRLREFDRTGPTAVSGFQARAGLKVDGITGPRTCAALGLGDAWDKAVASGKLVVRGSMRDGAVRRPPSVR